MRVSLRNLGYLTILCLGLVSCRSRQPQADINRDLSQLMELMSGSFSSEAQAAADTNYYPITLYMTPIWPDRGAWLYVEQALATAQDRPYRQRVYRLEQVAAGQFRSVVYTLPNPDAFIGAWKTPGSFASLNPLELALRGGCDVFLTKTGRNSYAGATQGHNCESSLRGASYASSEVTINQKGIISWDRGFDANDQQVWGATEGGYEFRRR